MAERTLEGCRIFVVEDDYFVADYLRYQLHKAGAVVLGPAGTVTDALGLIGSRQPIDAALLDVDLHGEKVFPVADLLVAQGVPLMFITGYDASEIPSRFRHVVRHEKPMPVDVADAVRCMIQR